MCCAVVAALVVVSPASADDPPPPEEVSAADAYRESVPTARGPKPTGQDSGRSTLTPAVSARLDRDPGSALLREVATSAAYGAPRERLRRPAKPARADRNRAIGPSSRAASPQAPSTRVPSVNAASVALGDAVGGGRLVLLVALLLAIVLGAIALRVSAARARIS